MNAVLFFSYDFASRALSGNAGRDTDTEREQPMSEVFAAGIFGGLMSSFVTGPTELIKCIAQTNLNSKGLLREEWQIVRNMVQKHGLFGAFGPTRGLGLTILRDSPR